ncbi:MAG: cadmium-translocating P-type ATPase [Ruminococcus sp.]|nr:cadmium-translocating P-type ATPase [Ruminococcus sp.]
MTRKQTVKLIRIIIAVVLTAVAVIISPEGLWALILYLLPWAVVGYDVVTDAVLGIFRGQFLDEKFLMTLATAGAFAVGEHIEAVAVMLFFQIGELFESIAVGKSRKNIRALMDIRPDKATVLRGGEEHTVSPDEVSVGENIVVKPGERIPLDGVIVLGSTTVDTSALTGESLPAELSTGDKVISGTVNLSGVITVQVQSEFAQSTVQRVLELVETASAKKARTEAFITRFAKVYTPCVVAGAVLLAVIPPLLFAGSWSEWIYRGLVFLAVSCPCALVISVPLSFFGGIGRASREGILIKGASYMEVLAKVRTVVLDKTGTLTQGRFSVASVHPADASAEELLRAAAYAESRSLHPIAQSIVAAYSADVDESLITQMQEHTGKGVEAVVQGHRILAGNKGYISSVVNIPDIGKATGTIVYVARDEEYLGYILLSDKVKPDSAQAIGELKALGVERTVMLTGDRRDIAEEIGRELQLDSVFAELLPANKVEAVEELIPEHSPVAFVGDGINDAPVLSRCDVGVAMGGMGSDAAIEAADVVLMDDKLSKLPEAVRISRRTVAIVRQNIIFALAIKALVLILGAVGIAGMWAAIFADVGVMILAILNSMRTLIVRKKKS